MLWNDFSNRLIFTATLVTQTGLRIGGSGQSADPAAPDLPVIKDAQGMPFIPGSSLRGALRSHIERIVRTLQPEVGEGRGACNPLDEKNWCVTKDRLDAWDERWREDRDKADPDRKSEMERERDAHRATWIFEQTCCICRVFGSPWLASRVRLSDLFCVHTVHPETRDGVAIDREKETVKERGKFDFETVPVDSLFSLEILADNLDEQERGLLWLGIEELKRGQILVGGFKGRGLGRVTLTDERLRMVDGTDRQGLRQYLLSGEPPGISTDQAEKWMDAFIHSLSAGGQ